jgi:hypothetical protein
MLQPDSDTPQKRGHVFIVRSESRPDDPTARLILSLPAHPDLYTQEQTASPCLTHKSSRLARFCNCERNLAQPLLCCRQARAAYLREFSQVFASGAC